ncbi:MAG TPA: phosphoglycolate phosphatase [Burkholderiales bacterium]|nr:phosphoglycolate phosphatase [Burkholderiales bacterium]
MMLERTRLAVKAVMIDLDGTLLDTAQDLATAANLTLNELGHEKVDPEIVKTFIGKGVVNLMRKSFIASTEGEPEDMDAVMDVFDRHYDAVVSKDSRPYPGVIEGLEAMKSSGFHLACITNKAERFTIPLLKDTGLYGYFEIVLSGDSLPKKKPDPMPLLHACRHFGIEPSEMLLIGDSVNDVQAARAAGCSVFCVPYGYNEGNDVRELDSDALVESLLDASGLIEKND